MIPSTNFGAAADDYARHRAGFPPSAFARLRALGVGGPGARILDLGTGTGTLARGFAADGATVTGVDPDARMIAQGRTLAGDLPITWMVGRAEATGLPDAAFDAVTAGQCWHWFDRDVVAREALRMVRPGGALVIAHFDWVLLPGNLADLTEDLIRVHNPAWTLGGSVGLYPQWLPGLGAAGFADLETFSYDMDVPYTPLAWRGRIRACAGVGASLDAEGVARFDDALAALIADRFPGATIAVPHRVWMVVGRRPGPR